MKGLNMTGIENFEVQNMKNGLEGFTKGSILGSQLSVNAFSGQTTNGFDELLSIAFGHKQGNEKHLESVVWKSDSFLEKKESFLSKESLKKTETQEFKTEEKDVGEQYAVRERVDTKESVESRKDDSIGTKEKVTNETQTKNNGTEKTKVEELESPKEEKSEHNEVVHEILMFVSEIVGLNIQELQQQLKDANIQLTTEEGLFDPVGVQKAIQLLLGEKLQGSSEGEMNLQQWLELLQSEEAEPKIKSATEGLLKLSEEQKNRDGKQTMLNHLEVETKDVMEKTPQEWMQSMMGNTKEKATSLNKTEQPENQVPLDETPADLLSVEKTEGTSKVNVRELNVQSFFLTKDQGTASQKNGFALGGQEKAMMDTKAGALLPNNPTLDKLENMQKIFKTEKNAMVQKESILNQIVKHAKVTLSKTNSQMDVELRPEHLGKISLKIITEQGRVTARMFTENVEVKQVIESHFSQLKEALESQGIKVEGFSVNVGRDKENQPEEQDTSQQDKEKKERKILDSHAVSVRYDVAKSQDRVKGYMQSEWSSINLTA